jgi:hypothetical protein
MEVATKVRPVYVCTHLHNLIIDSVSFHIYDQLAALLIKVYHSNQKPPEVYRYMHYSPICESETKLLIFFAVHQLSNNFFLTCMLTILKHQCKLRR